MDTKEYKILILEDVPADAELMERELKKGGLHFVSKRVAIKEDFSTALDTFAPDLILADYKLPQFDGFSALAIAKEKCPDTPFIFVTGAMGDELAVETLKQGAVDYVLKDKLPHLLPAVERAFRNVASLVEKKRIDQAKTEFIALASHQLKTPLTAIKLLTERLCGGNVGTLTEKQKEYFDDIRSSNQRMIDLVNALLSVSRIELGAFTIQVSEKDACAIVQSIVAELKFVIDKKQLKLTTISPEKNMAVMLDEPLFRMVIHNLITNAIHYTSEGGEIRVECKAADKGQALGGRPLEENCFVVVVSDTGYGIPEGEQSNVFTKFFRADNAREKHIDGTGLGLYIAKSILDHAGGLIWFTSREHEGSVFYAAIPMTGMRAKAGEKSLLADKVNYNI